MSGLKRLVIGVGHSPQVVGAARAALLYLLPLGVAALVAWLATIRDPHWLWLAALVPLVRAIEGAVIDQAFKADQNAVDPTAVAGGGSPDILT